MGRKRRILVRQTYTKLGIFLRNARRELRDPDTGKSFTVGDMARLLNCSQSFVYQVEKGNRKPNDGDLASWASVYGKTYVDICKCLDRIPMDLVASLKNFTEPPPSDPFLDLTEIEKKELLPFLNFVRWQLLKERLH